MIKKLSLTQRAAAAVRSDSTSAELRKIHREVGIRLEQVEKDLKSLEIKIPSVEGDGDLEALREIRTSTENLKDEERVLLRQRTDLYHEIKNAAGKEAIAAESQHKKNLNSALRQAEKALTILGECRESIMTVIQARRHAVEIGQDLITK